MQGIIKNVCLTNKGICNVKVTMIKVSVILNLIMITNNQTLALLTTFQTYQLVTNTYVFGTQNKNQITTTAGETILADKQTSI